MACIAYSLETHGFSRVDTHLKNIFIKNPHAVSEDDAYIRVGTNNSVVEKYESRANESRYLGLQFTLERYPTMMRQRM